MYVSDLARLSQSVQQQVFGNDYSHVQCLHEPFKCEIVVRRLDQKAKNP